VTRRLVVRLGAAAFALGLALPLPATVWTRANVTVRVARGERVPIENASYTGRDWSVSLTAIEVREGARAAQGTVVVSWVFHYTNTDKEPHYVALNVRCLDARRTEGSRFSATAVLQADRPGGATVEVGAKMAEEDWKKTAWAKVIVDFLSGPQG
jgi:hypothetical protein